MLSLEPETVREEDLLKVKFGRNRFVKLIGGALLGSATAFAMRDAPAEAHHGSPPYPCFGYPKCHYCSGRICTQYCSWPSNHSHCPSGGQCWNTCVDGGYMYRCCDWHETFPEVPLHHCICVERWGGCA